MEYEIGLDIYWTDRELQKIREIKARRVRSVQNSNGIREPWDDKKIRHYKAIKAMCLLEECGIDRDEIAKLFDVSKKTVSAYIDRNRGWR